MAKTEIQSKKSPFARNPARAPHNAQADANDIKRANDLWEVLIKNLAPTKRLGRVLLSFTGINWRAGSNSLELMEGKPGARALHAGLLTLTPRGSHALARAWLWPSVKGLMTAILTMSPT